MKIKQLLIFIIIFIFFTTYLKYKYNPKLIWDNISNNNRKEDSNKNEMTRDFIRYTCKNRVRIGGQQKFIRNAPNSLWRIDGAWSICLDKAFKLNKNDCLVYSFGISSDYSFDQTIRNEYACNIYSFDPFVEDDLFKNRRNESQVMKIIYVN